MRKLKKLFAMSLAACMVFNFASISPSYAANVKVGEAVDVNIVGGAMKIADVSADITGEGVNVTDKGVDVTDEGINITDAGTDISTEDNVEVLPRVTAPTKNADTKSWDGTIDSKWQGKGTKTNPYQIYTPEQFAGMCANSSKYVGSYFKLMNDIDLGGKPLRSNDPDGDWGGQDWGKLSFVQFYSIFDGNYHNITGFYQKTSKGDSNGLFGLIDQKAGISNLTLCGKSDVGGAFAGVLDGSLENCTNFVNCNGESCGIVENVKSSAIVKGCNNYGSMLSVKNSGGISAFVSGSIYGCNNWGEILSSGNNTYSAGGIAGYLASSGDISDCYNYGTVTCNDVSGGIAGRVFGDNCRIKYSFNYGDVEGGSYVGGIAGNMYTRQGSLENCVNKGNVTCRTGSYCGVLSGYEGIAKCCYAICNIDGNASKKYIREYGAYNCYYVGNMVLGSDAEYCKVWTTYPTDGVIDINGGFDYYEVNGMSELQNGFPVLAWEKDKFAITESEQIDASVDSLKIRWNFLARATGYQVYRYDKQTKEMTLIDTINTNIFSESGLKDNTEYQYVVRAYIIENDHTYFSDFSKVISAKTLAKQVDNGGNKDDNSGSKDDNSGNKDDEVYYYGDVDNDKNITLKDAKLILKFALAIETPANEIVKIQADVNKDGKVNLNDAKLVLLAALGIER